MLLIISSCAIELFKFSKIDKNVKFQNFSRHLVKVTGQFYVKPDYPKGTEETEEHLDKAKVFRYTSMEVFKKDIEYSTKDDTALNLSYNAIECTCAQWTETKKASDTTGEYYFLEPVNDKLINADELWKATIFLCKSR